MITKSEIVWVFLGAGVLVWLWRAPAAYELKAAALACACLLTTPYVLDYDLVVLAVAIAYFTRYALADGFREYEISLLAFVWVAPLVARSLAGVGSVPLGLMAMLVLYALTLRRAVASLYSGDHRAMEVLIWKDLLKEIEGAIDRCEDIANTIESTKLKFA